MDKNSAYIKKLKEIYSKLSHLKEKENSKNSLINNETELKIPIDELSDNLYSELKKYPSVKKIKFLGNSSVDINKLIKIASLNNIEQIDFDEITLYGDYSGELVVGLQKEILKKIKIDKLNVDLPLIAATMFLNETTVTEKGTIKCTFDSVLETNTDSSIKNKENAQQRKYIIELFLKNIGENPFTIDYGDFEINDPETLKKIYLENKISLCSELNGEKEFFDIDNITIEDMTKYLEKLKGKKELYAYGNIPASVNFFDLIHDVLGDVNITALNTIDIRNSMKDNEKVNYAYVAETNNDTDRRYYTLLYNGILLKNIGNYHKKQCVVDINGVYDYDEFSQYFDELIKEPTNITLKTKNKTTFNLEKLNKYKGQKNIEVEYELPIISYSNNDRLATTLMKMLLKKESTAISSLEDFCGMRETIDWVKGMASDNYNPDLSKIVFVYDFMKTFPYKDNPIDKNESREIHSVLSGEYIVCLGYAKIFAQILNEMGIKTIVACNEKHAYNIVKIDDDIMDVHGLYKFDATNENIYMKKNNSVITDTSKQLGLDTFEEDNLEYNLAFRRLNNSTTLLNKDIYESSTFEKYILNLADGNESKKLEINKELDYLFGKNYSQEELKKYVYPQPISTKQLSDAIVLAKENAGYDFKNIAEEINLATYIWDTLTEENKHK